jgi:predicted amidohydrolase
MDLAYEGMVKKSIAKARTCRRPAFGFQYGAIACMIPPMRVLGCQFDIAWENKPANYETVRRLLRQAGPPRDSLVVLPEMFATGFSMNMPSITESPQGETPQFLSQVAREFGVCVVGGVVTPGAGGRGRNEAMAFASDGRELARFAKLHTFTYAGEGEHYECGNDVVLFRCGEWTVSPLVCYDLRFPEIFRRAARRGAELFVVIANWPTARIAHWLALLQARAIENQAYVIGVNRCGRTPKLDYEGRSVIVDFQGRLVADAGNGEGVIAADLDRPAFLDWRREFPALADLRPEFLSS